MSKTYYILTLALLTFLSIRCRSQKPLTLENYKRDSIFVREVIRDTVVTIDRDSSMMRALVRCDSLGEAYISEIVELRNGERSQAPTVEIKKNILTTKAVVDSMDIYLQLKERHTSHTIVAKEEVMAEVDVMALLSPWQRAIMTLGYIALSIIGIASIRLATKIFT